MFCSQCGQQLPQNAKFCASCGTAVDGGGQRVAQEPDTREPVLTVRPQFIPWVTIAAIIPLQIFFTLWGGGFFGGFSMVGLQVLDLPIPPWAPFVFFGALFFFGIPIIAYTAKKRTYDQTEYRFYKDRLEYAEGFWTAEDKTVRYDKITETALRRGVVQKKYGLGTIFLATPATGFQQGKSTSGIKIVDIEEPEKVYGLVQKLVGA